MPAKPPVSAAADTRSIEVFRPGTFTPMQGAAVTMSADDLRRLASAYDLDGAPAPVVVGHPRTNAPAYGWAHSFAYDEGSQRLVARVGDLEPEFEQAVKDKRYRKISLSLFPPDAPNNPKPGFWYPKHIGFLGGAAPAVSGLAPVQLAAGDDAVTFEFGEPAFSSIAELFRKLRDWLIEKEGAEAADKVLSDWNISWIDRASERDDDGRLFAAPPAPITPETPMSKPDAAAAAATEAAFAEREARLAEREAQVAQRAAEAHHAAHLSFAEGLIAEGRLTPAQRDRAVAVLDAAATMEQAEVSFAEGDRTVKTGLADALRDLLKAAPVAVTYGRHPIPPMDGAAVSFAAPAGADVSAEGLETLAKANAWRAKNPQASFLDAVRAVTA